VGGGTGGGAFAPPPSLYVKKGPVSLSQGTGVADLTAFRRFYIIMIIIIIITINNNYNFNFK
jgi:hypothetical protein